MYIKTLFHKYGPTKIAGFTIIAIGLTILIALWFVALRQCLGGNYATSLGQMITVSLTLSAMIIGAALGV